MFIDTHCHLDYPDYMEKDSKTTEDILQEAKDKDVNYIISVSADISSLNRTKELANKYSNVYCSQGLHPSVAENVKETDFIHIENNLSNPKCVAVGEIGLDYHYKPYDENLQKTLFIRQLELAIDYNKPVIIHSRDAETDILDIMKNTYLNSFVVHSYTGPLDTLTKFLDLGAFVSFNGIATFKNAHNVHDLVRYTPIDRIILETDAPYLAPTPYRGKLNYPKYIPNIANAIAKLKKLELKTVEEATTYNAIKLFKLNI